MSHESKAVQRHVHNTFTTHCLHVVQVVQVPGSIKNLHKNNNIIPSDYLGPVVECVVSLTSSLRVISLTVLANSIYNILIFFAEKM